jgi:hypothetical protein
MTPLAATEAERLEREAFEQWMIHTEKCVVGSSDPYPAGMERQNWKTWRAAWQAARALQQTAEPVRPSAPENSIRAFPEFREYVERLSEPGLAKKQARVIRKEIYDIIDARVANAKIAGSPQKPVGYFSKGGGSSYGEVDPKYKNAADVVPLYAAPDRAPSTDSAADARDAARYKWLRHADLDAMAAQYWPDGEVPEGEALDVIIDAAIAASLPQTKEE